MRMRELNRDSVGGAARSRRCGARLASLSPPPHTMPKELERDLGLFAVIAISIGAMVGSGIFILPGLALKTAGPAVILAYLLAGVLVLPAALSKAEMATAMPEAGGIYIYIERGPMPRSM